MIEIAEHVRDYPLYRSRPGRYETNRSARLAYLVEGVTLDGDEDERVGGSEIGWGASLIVRRSGRELGGWILEWTDRGSVHVASYLGVARHAEMMSDWREIELAAHAAELPADEEYLEEFFQGYAECAVWASSDVPPDGVDDIAPDSLEAMREDCRAFIEGDAELLAQLPADYPPEHAPDSAGRTQYSAAEAAGHDFWLTRNRHGAGFWDRGLGELGDKLTAACRPYGEATLYIGDDGRLHYQS